VLPGLYLAYLLAAPTRRLVQRCGHVALSALLALAVSLSFVSVVALVPAHDRPYADGSCNDSLFGQVFLYNGADRLGGEVLDQPGCSPPPSGTVASAAGAATTVALGKGPGRFLSGPFGRDAAWLLVPGLVSLVGVLVARRGRPRTDRWRAAALLWGMWLFMTWTFFASSRFLNSYYLAALAPPLAALCGLGLVLAWRQRARSPAVRALVMATVVVGVAYAVSLVPGDAGVRPWVVASSALVGAASLVCLGLGLAPGRGSNSSTGPGVASASASASAPGPGPARRRYPRSVDGHDRLGFGLAAVALLLGAGWATATAVADGLGPFDAPYQPAAQTAAEHLGWEHAVATWPALAAAAAQVPSTQSVLTAETSAEVSMQILATGREFLPVGGFSGQVPSTTTAEFVHDVRAGRVADVAVLVRPHTRNPDMAWVLAHCAAVRGRAAGFVDDGRDYRRYACSPGDAADPHGARRAAPTDAGASGQGAPDGAEAQPVG